MSDNHILDKDGVRKDDVAYFEADDKRLQSYTHGAQALSGFQTPVLVHADNPHERLYFPAFDGTGNDLYKDPEHATNVAKIYMQIIKGSNKQISAG